MNRTEVEGRIFSALEVATNKDEARAFIVEAISGETFQNLQIHWDCSGYRCADLRWFDTNGMKQELIVDVDKVENN